MFPWLRQVPFPVLRSGSCGKACPAGNVCQGGTCMCPATGTCTVTSFINEGFPPYPYRQVGIVTKLLCQDLLLPGHCFHCRHSCCGCPAAVGCVGSCLPCAPASCCSSYQLFGEASLCTACAKPLILDFWLRHQPSLSLLILLLCSGSSAAGTASQLLPLFLWQKQLRQMRTDPSTPTLREASRMQWKWFQEPAATTGASLSPILCGPQRHRAAHGPAPTPPLSACSTE